MMKHIRILDFAILFDRVGMLRWELLLLLVILVATPVVAHAEGATGYGRESSSVQYQTGRLVQDAANLIAAVEPLPQNKVVAVVNHFVNERIRYEADLTLYGQVEYWAAPQETLGRGAGDCEDIAIAKYSLLLKAGISAEELRFMHVQLAKPHTAHLVLVWDHEGQKQVLDNMTNVIIDIQNRNDLTPVYSFNEFQLWIGVDVPTAGNANRLSRWKDMMARWH